MSAVGFQKSDLVISVSVEQTFAALTLTYMYPFGCLLRRWVPIKDLENMISQVQGLSIHLLLAL